MIAAMALGWKYAALSVLIEMIPRAFIIPHNYLSIAGLLVPAVWIIYHGLCSDAHKKSKKIYLTPYLAEIPFRILLTAGTVLTAVYFSNASWFTTIGLKHPASGSSVYPLIITDMINAYLIIMLSDFLLNLDISSRIFKFDKSFSKNMPGHIFLGFTIGSIAFWIIDSFLDYYLVYHRGLSPAEPVNLDKILFTGIHTRLALSLVIIGFGLAISIIIRKYYHSKKRYRDIVENMYDGFAVMDRNGDLTYVNESICRMLGYASGELLNKNILEFLDDDNRKILMSQIDLRKLGETRPYEINFKTRAGGIVTTLLSPQLVFDKKGKFMESFAVIRDISERKCSELKLRESEEKFRTLTEQSPSMLVINNEKTIL